MANTFPTTLNDWEANETIESAWADALEAKIGADSSAVATSLDYLLKNSSSSNPGHKHTLADGATDITADAAEINKLDGMAATKTELGYVSGVTSAIQTQINGKEDSLGYTPENSANKKTDLTDNSDTYYASQKAVKTAVDAKQDALGYTAENAANKKTDLSDNSDTYYPSQKAVKTAVDAKQDTLGYTAENTANKKTDLTGDSDTYYPSQKAVKTAVDAKIANVSEDTTPELGGEMDCGAHSIGFTQQTATGDGTTTIDWKLGNKMYFTFGAFNETFTFTAPSNPCNLVLVLKQDGVGSRTATWPATVMWPGGTAPTLTTAAAGVDIVSMYWDGTNYHAVASLAFAVPA